MLLLLKSDVSEMEMLVNGIFNHCMFYTHIELKLCTP